MVESLAQDEPLDARKLVWPGTKLPKLPGFKRDEVLQIIKKVR